MSIIRKPCIFNWFIVSVKQKTFTHWRQSWMHIKEKETNRDVHSAKHDLREDDNSLIKMLVTISSQQHQIERVINKKRAHDDDDDVDDSNDIGSIPFFPQTHETYLSSIFKLVVRRPKLRSISRQSLHLFSIPLLRRRRHRRLRHHDHRSRICYFSKSGCCVSLYCKHTKRI